MLRELGQDRSIDEVLESLAEGRRVYALQAADGEHLHLGTAEAWIPGSHTLGPYRPVENVKSLFFRPREYVGRVFETPAAPETLRPRSGQAPGEGIVFGVKNCDLASLSLHDTVFRESDPPDPFYTGMREHTLVVSCDCTACLDVCFCTAMGDGPYPEHGFDINISPLPSGFVFETGSPRGEEALEKVNDLLTEASDERLAERDAARQRMRDAVADQAARHGMTGDHDYRAAVVAAAADAALWQDFAETCVECGACNFCCCTCHCFLLCDGVSPGNTAARIKQWDSCLFQNFARMAGGGNPRARRAHRLHNRFEKKFVFFRDLSGTYACDGCGRCIEACIGQIDIRAVLKRAVDDSKSIPAHAG